MILDCIFFSKHFFDLGFDDEAPPPPGQEKTKKKRKSKPNQKIRKRMKLLKEEQRMAEEMDAEWFSINLNTLILNFKVHIFWEGHKILRNLHLTFVLCNVVPVKSKVKISQNYVAFSEYMNFTYLSYNLEYRLFVFQDIVFFKKFERKFYLTVSNFLKINNLSRERESPIAQLLLMNCLFLAVLRKKLPVP